MINYNAQDEQLFQSVSSLMAGNMESYYTMYDLSIKYIYKIIYDIVKDYHTTEDLVQETYITIYNKINTLQDPRKFYSWAGRIATNHTLRYIQNNRRELLTLDVEDGDSDFIFDLASQDNEEFIPENILMDMEKQRLIAEIIDGLSVEQKLAVQYFYYEELSVREIAELMGCSEGTIKSRLNYARKSIKEAIIDLDVNEDTRLYSLSALPIFFIVFKTAVEQFVFAGTATGTAMASGMATSGAEVIGEGAVTNGAGVIGQGATSSGASAVGGTSNAGQAVVMGEAAGTSAGVTTGTSISGTVASGVGKGFLAKIGTSLGAKMAAGVVATGLVVAGGVAIHHVVTENNETPTEITTEVFEEASESDADSITTEAIVEEVNISDEELLALNTMAINLTATAQWKDIRGKSLDIDDAIVWEFVGRMNNNAQYDGVETKYMPDSVKMNVYTLEDMNVYATNVFGIDDLEYVNNFWFSDQGDGTYYLTAAQMGDLDKCVINSISVDGDVYTVVGVVSWGEVMDLNQTEPSYSINTTFEFNMEVVKNADSPFGFKVNSISYIQGMMADLESTEPPTVTVEGAEENKSENEREDENTSSNSNSSNTETTGTESQDSANQVDGNDPSEDNVNPVVHADVPQYGIDPNTTDATMLKYLEVIDGVCNKGVWPDGTAVTEFSLSDISQNSYGVLDIVGDENKELIISITNTSMAGKVLKIFSYNSQTDELTQVISTWTNIELWDNGDIHVMDSTNQSYSMNFWPYETYYYDANKGSYVLKARVEGWEKSIHPEGFPEIYNYSGDDFVYVITHYRDGDRNNVEYVQEAGLSEFLQWGCCGCWGENEITDYLAEPMANVLR